jgi:hypothetical protein
MNCTPDLFGVPSKTINSCDEAIRLKQRVRLAAVPRSRKHIVLAVPFMPVSPRGKTCKAGSEQKERSGYWNSMGIAILVAYLPVLAGLAVLTIPIASVLTIRIAIPIATTAVPIPSILAIGIAIPVATIAVVLSQRVSGRQHGYATYQHQPEQAAEECLHVPPFCLSSTGCDHP